MMNKRIAYKVHQMGHTTGHHFFIRERAMAKAQQVADSDGFTTSVTFDGWPIVVFMPHGQAVGRPTRDSQKAWDEWLEWENSYHREMREAGSRS